MSADSAFAEMEASAAAIRESPMFAASIEDVEPLLIERGLPLINIALASYGTNREVFKALYGHSLEAPANASDSEYKRGLRLACLSNETIQRAHWIFRFPQDLIGLHNLTDALNSEEYCFADALIRNPKVADELIEQLYLRTGVFADIDEGRLRSLISSSRHNPRLGTNEDDDESPDLGHYRIHEAMGRLIETAPVNHHWMWSLYDLLNNVAPAHATRSIRLIDVLDRWKALNPTEPAGKAEAGLFVASISQIDEFRSIIASLYGRALSADELRTMSSSKDPAYRAAFYGAGKLSSKDMQQGYERDASLFVFSAIRNWNITGRQELKKLFEEDMLYDDFEARYKKFLSVR